VALVARASSIAERLARHAKLPGLPPLTSVAGVDGAPAASFGEAAGAFHQAAPWRAVPVDRAIRVESPPLRQEPFVLMVLGDRTAERGLVLHYHPPSFTMAVQGWLLGDQITWAPFQAVFFDAGEPFAVMNDGHGGTAREPGSTLRRPRADELRLMEACLRAVPAFVERQATASSAPQEVTVPTAGGEVRMALSWVTHGQREL
jgi:hypothetical protein